MEHEPGGITVSNHEICILRDEIQTQLAAIRNALHLIASRSDDFLVLEYVWLAEQQTHEVARSVSRRIGKGKAA